MTGRIQLSYNTMKSLSTTMTTHKSEIELTISKYHQIQKDILEEKRVL